MPDKMFHPCAPLFAGAISSGFVSYADEKAAFELADYLNENEQDGWTYTVREPMPLRFAVEVSDADGNVLGLL